MYSASLLAAAPAIIPVMFILDRWNISVSCFGVLMNVLGGWLRYIGCKEKNGIITVLSSVPIGLAASVVVCSYTALSACFPKHKRSLATSIAVQSNYVGWLVGAMVLPRLVKKPEDFETVMLQQAIAGSCSIVLFALFHRKPDVQEEDEFVSGKDESCSAMVTEFKLMLSNPQYLVECLCYCIVGGISFAIPGVQDALFHSIGFTPDEDSWTNFAFIFTGNVVGVLLPCLVRKRKNVRPALNIVFLVVSISVVALAIITHETIWPNIKEDIGRDHLFVILLVLMMLAGGGSLGFIGVGLHSAAETVAPQVAETKSGGFVELWIQVFGAVFSLIAPAIGFKIMGAVAVLIVLISFIFNHPSEKKESLSSQGFGSYETLGSSATA